MMRTLPIQMALVALVATLLPIAGRAQEPTPPVMPKLQEVSLPERVEVPPSPAALPGVSDRPLTAAEAAVIALHHQPSIASARAAVAGAQARTAEVRSGRAATLSVAATVTEAESFGGDGTVAGLPSAFQLSATARQLLYDFNHTRDLISVQQDLERVAGASLTTAQVALILQVKQSFYGYVQAERLVTVSEANVASQRQHLALADARLRSGLGLPYDVVRAEAAVADAVYGLTVARREASGARVSLAQLMGIDPRTAVQVAEGGEAVAESDNVQEAIDRALTERPELRGAQAAVDSSRHAIAAARTTSAPVVSGQAGLQRRGGTFFDDPNGLTVGVGVVWTPSDGGLRQARVREAQANLTAAQATLEAVRLQVVADVSQAYLDRKTTEQRVVTAQAQVVNAEEALRLATGRYRSGIGVFIDVLDAQTSVDVAHTNLVNSQTAVDQARAAYAHATGADLAQIPAP